MSNWRKDLTTSTDLFKILPKELVLWDDRICLRKSTAKKATDRQKYPREKLEGWPPNKGSYEIRDPASPVAFVCPSQNQDLQAKAISWGAAISGPCVTPDRGVELVVANLIANPNIRYLVLGGLDSGHLSGDVLYCLWRYGLDAKNRRVHKTHCPTNPYIRNLPLKIIERFREQITVINLLKCPDEEIIHLAIRVCLQEPEFPLIWQDKKLDLELKISDVGAEGREPLIFRLGFDLKKTTTLEGVFRVGATIHAPTVSQAWPILQSHLLEIGEIGINESTRKVKDTVGAQIVIHCPGQSLVPRDWCPHGWLKNKKQTQEWLAAYVIWVYLFPYSDVRFNEKTQEIEPYIPEKMDYSYGTRLTAWGIESASEVEQKAVRRLVEQAHKNFSRRLPRFPEVVKFYQDLAKTQKQSVNSLYLIAQATKNCVQNEITAAYRNYLVLQDPRVDLKADLRLSHNPCFCLFESYPRKIKDKWQLDAGMFFRANDFMAFPANAAGGIKLQEFLAWYSGIPVGIYLHHTGCCHIQDYLW